MIPGESRFYFLISFSRFSLERVEKAFREGCESQFVGDFILNEGGVSWLTAAEEG